MCYNSVEAGRLGMETREAIGGEFLHTTRLPTGGTVLRGEKDGVIACVVSGTRLQVSHVPEGHEVSKIMKPHTIVTFMQKGHDDRIFSQGMRFPLFALLGFQFQVVPQPVMAEALPKEGVEPSRLQELVGTAAAIVVAFFGFILGA